MRMLAPLPSLSPLLDVTEQFEEIAKKLPKGIVTELLVSGMRVYLQYSVRVSIGGKRTSLGKFFTLEGALQARSSAQIGSVMKLADVEILAREQVRMQFMGFHTRMDEEKERIKQLVKPADEIGMELISELLADVPDYKFDGETSFDRVDKNGNLYHITIEQISAWLAWRMAQPSNENEFSSDNVVAQEGVVLASDVRDPIEDPLESAKGEAEIDIETMSDEEYNKLLGLD